jgi:hypothetical protein
MKSILAPASDPQVKVDLRWRQKLHAETVQRQQPRVKRPPAFRVVKTSRQPTGIRSEHFKDWHVDLQKAA